MPETQFVSEHLALVNEIGTIGAATAENDVNEQLGKEHGYTSAVFFSIMSLNADEIDYDELIESGTDVGGCVEVFKTVEDVVVANRDKL